MKFHIFSDENSICLKKNEKGTKKVSREGPHWNDWFFQKNKGIQYIT